MCETAVANDAILVAVDVDIKQLSKRFKNQNERFKKLSVVLIACNSVMASKRLAQAMSMIELEWEISRQKTASRLWLEIANHRFTTYR